MKQIILGTRGSKLALIQTEIIKNHLYTLFPKVKIDIKIIKTTGDKNMNPVPLDTIGKNWFTKEIDKALLDGTIDAAVHSLKDLPETLPDDLIIAAIPQREDAREAFISNNNVSFNTIKKSAIIGTDSTRRKAQLLHKRSDIIVQSIRGNVNKRLEKLKNGDYDGIFLAVAGLKRLGLENIITEYFSEVDVIPSPGQGALAVVCKKNNKQLLTILKKLNHQPTLRAVKAERSFSKIFGGGCSMPIGAYATCDNKELILHGMVGSLDGKYILKDSIRGSASSPIALGKTLSFRMIKKSSPWYTTPEKPFVVITRPEKKKKYLMNNIKSLGLQPFFYPTIKIKKMSLSKKDQEYIKNFETFHSIMFTSKNGVRFFNQTLTTLKINILKNNKIRIAAVGKKTADELKKNGLTTYFTPEIFTAENLVKEMQQIENKKILLLRGDLAESNIIKQLEKKGAKVVNISIYKTELITSPNKDLEELLTQKKVKYLTFTSPSTVKGFLKNVRNKNIFATPVISIGPVTTKELKKSGFKQIYTADTFTEEGMYIKLKEILV
jgi:hydroxymethylbilane synthase